MMELRSITDIQLLRESVDVECKLALGRHKQGALPEDFWSTYSAFANTDGGTVILGLREKQGRFIIEGIANVASVRKVLFDTVNNKQKVSVNLLTDAMVTEVTLENRHLLLIHIPRANRKQRPVHLTKNPFDGNTYRRLNEADCALADEEIKRMLAEQIEDSRDDRLLNGYGFEDLNQETFRVYRQVFTNREPAHLWNTYQDADFLRHIGGCRRDRETGEQGLTLAGLLMFGQQAVIQEVLPNYMLDYQERPEPKTDIRWLDRITLDGKWSGNLYDFYRKVYLKLTADLKVPFRLEAGERKDETPVHEALREALANALVHADYSDRASLLIIKRPEMFGFRNPGLMRIPLEVALQGGEADCRNRTLHKMFRLVGVGEQAGTGIPKILYGWRSQHWSPPKLYETTYPYNQTRLELRMIDLLPERVIIDLQTQFGARFEQLNHVQRVALALAACEGTVNHARLRTITSEHPVDLSKTLQQLKLEGWLESTGGRGAIYHLPGKFLPMPEDVFGQSRVADEFCSPVLTSSSPHLTSSSPHLTSSSPHLTSSSPHLTSSSPHLTSSSPVLREARNSEGCLLTAYLNQPIVDDLNELSTAFREHLEVLAKGPRQRKKMQRQDLIEVILRLCENRYVSLRCLSELVHRQPAALRDRYLSVLVRERKLMLAFPGKPTHEKQAYCATNNE